MDSVLDSRPSTQTCAKSAGPSPPSRDPMEDANSSGTRKRPRLDSGNRTHRSMSADRLRTSLSSNEPSNNLETLVDEEAASYSMHTANRLAPMASTPSKVTINVRGPARSTPPIRSPSAVTSVSIQREGGDIDDLSSGHQDSSNVVSVSSSPMRSPEIEVAEVEDVNDESRESRWRPIGSVVDVRQLHADLMEAFPFTLPLRNTRKILGQVATTFQKQDLENTDELGALSVWLENFLGGTEPYSTYWLEFFIEYKVFWDEFPNIADALTRRSNTRLGTIKTRQAVHNGVLSSQDELQDFLVAFTGLVVRMARIDSQILDKDSGEDSSVQPDLISAKYIHSLGQLLQNNGDFWRCLVDLRRYDPVNTTAAMVTRFVLPPQNGIECVAYNAKELLNRSQSFPVFAQRVWPHINVVLWAFDCYNKLPDVNPHKSRLSSLPCQAYRLFEVVDLKYQKLISKQVSALSIDNSGRLLDFLFRLLSCCLLTDEQLLLKIARETRLLPKKLSIEDTRVLVPLAWRFGLLKKCILEGRMEIRVHGVENMQQSLVDIFKDYLLGNPAAHEHPLAQYLSDFILDSKLVEYFVGVESHAQLVHRCGNIVGFLVVAGRYTNAESDAIWKSVTSSRDSRWIDAILSMVMGFFKISSYELLLYLTIKLNEISIHAFDSTMIHYGRSLIDGLRKTWRTTREEGDMDMPPFNLCIRLIREGTAESSLDLQRKREIQSFATAELRSLSSLGPKDTDLKAIYQECLDDIAHCSENATGSISAITAILFDNHQADIISLARDSNLARLLVDELIHMVDISKSSASPLAALHENLSIRLSMLSIIIVQVPDTISHDVGKHLWNVTVGPQAPDDKAREIAWWMILRVIRSSHVGNTFIEKCIRDYLPGLHPNNFVMSCLSFVSDVGHYQTRLLASKSAEEQEDIPSPRDLLWRFALKTPPDKPEFEQRAISDLVAEYLDSCEPSTGTRPTTDTIHIEVVERCICQLTTAASRLRASSGGTSGGDDEPMVTVALEDDLRSQKLSFTRSLMILKKLVHGVRTRPKYSPKPAALPQLPRNFREITGEPIKIQYQSFRGSSNTEIFTVEVGDLETVGELSQRLTLLTGFSDFKVIARGKIQDFSSMAEKTLRELDFHRMGLLLVKKAMSAESMVEYTPTSGLRPLEIEILTHFTELYQLLDMEESLAREVFDFLAMFPPHQSIMNLVCAKETPIATALPPATPFKIIYSVYALKESLDYQLHEGISTPGSICHAIQALDTTLTTINLEIDSSDSQVDNMLAARLIDCLLSYLKEPIAVEEQMTLFSDPQALLDRLRSITAAGLGISQNSEAGNMVCNCFATVLEASLHSEAFYTCLKESAELSPLIQRLLLEESRVQIRQGIAKTIESICCTLPVKSLKTPEDFIPYFWDSISAVIPRALNYSHTSQQFFDVANLVFRSVDEGRRSSLNLQDYTQNWSSLLCEHKHDEFVGHDTIDYVVFGLSRLILYCFHLSRSLNKPTKIPENFMKKLFHTHLFPDLSTLVSDDRISTRVPNLHTNTRAELYSIILALSNDMSGYQNLLVLIRELLPQGEGSNAWSWGIAQILEEYQYDANWNFDRSQCIRAPIGYSGLKNLSNTCYMNSLFSQLFMNIKFRAFVLNTNITYGDTSQRLLKEARLLFAFMQGTVLKSVDSQGIADSIETYDGGQIDVNIQMDVDEFYNLLFDRWEGQILTDAEKKMFRSFYGGQIVQQIKSRECPHISERLEPFSAIQCDIQGKQTLTESLNAYVGGEVMEGDNKYSCTSCGSYVDALKRACFKDTPDNLIFHLKRFDFDLMTGQRNKINDYFEFPEQIDMAPYHVDYLKDPKEPLSLDIFELVGVLVHSGSAESGHYYSYIQERPSNFPTPKSWVEYNDADVTSFNPRNIADQCFGGWTDNQYGTRFMKSWNAYMLFYERVDADKPAAGDTILRSSEAPVKSMMPQELRTRIIEHNEKSLRQYCLFDPAHAIFIKSVLEQSRRLSTGVCTQRHTMENDIIELSLDHLDQILSRTKDTSNFENMLDSLTRMIGSCSTCCRLSLEWLVRYDGRLRNMLLRCNHQKIRKDFSKMIIRALQYLRDNDPDAYGFNELGELPFGDAMGAFPHVATSLKNLSYFLYLHPRGWDEFFGVLAEMANLGRQESYVLLNLGFLRTSLETLVADHPISRKIRNDNSNYANYHRMLERGRKFALRNLTELVACLLNRLDLQLPPQTRDERDRSWGTEQMILSESEDLLLRFGTNDLQTSECCIFLDKILNDGTNLEATDKIVKAMVLAEPPFGRLAQIQKTIQSGISVEPASLAGSFLRAAIMFCECTPKPKTVESMIQYIAGEVLTIGNAGGREHLDFFKHVRLLRNLRPGQPTDMYTKAVRKYMSNWAPPLLMYVDEQIRAETVNLVNNLLFKQDLDTMDDGELAEELQTVGQHFCETCLEHCRTKIANQKTIDGSQVQELIHVIRLCLDRYCTSDEEFSVNAEELIGRLEALTVSDVDEGVSGTFPPSVPDAFAYSIDVWNNASDDIPTDSDSDAYIGGSP